VRVTRLRLRDFRSYGVADVVFGERLTVVHGRNGAGKTNLLEALYLGCTGRSCRTANERELVRFGAPATRVVVDLEDGRTGPHELTVAIAPGESKRLLADGAAVQRLVDVPTRPLVSVFLPDRLELVKGAPALRRAHVDALIAALWPTRASTRRDYAHALAQRNALLLRVRAGHAGHASLRVWDLELARHGVALRDDRAEAVALLVESFSAHADALGLAGASELRYRPRSAAATADELAGELGERVDSDLQRGFTGHGPHRDELVLARDGRELRAYGSQGEQRLALLALLLAERDAIGARRDHAPLMLLDDVMSELDHERRERLAAELATGVGQAVITTTDPGLVPVAAGISATQLAVAGGSVLSQAAAA
jgi:DNA replication and repair protein RecF